MTINELYHDSLKKIKNPDVEEINIRIIICFIKGYKTMSEFYTHKDEEFKEINAFNSYFSRYLLGEPIQYITNCAEFYGEQIYVDHRVLIPRQETEEVVDYAIKKAKEIFKDSEINVADVCCGSGCIGIALKRNLNIKNLFFTDVSFDAIDVTKFNCSKKKIDAKFLAGDLLNPLILANAKVDLLVSNPPYIINKKDVDKSVKIYEPDLALYTDEKLTNYRKIFSSLKKIKNKKNHMLVVFEIGYDLKDKLEEIVNKEFHKCKYEFVKDINGNYRILSIVLD